MSIVEESRTYKIEWQVGTSKDVKSDEIILGGNKACCIGVKSHSFHNILYLVCKSGHPSTMEIGDVFFSTCSAGPDQPRQKMIPVPGQHQNSTVHSAEIKTEWKAPLTLTLWIDLKPSVEDYSFTMMDSLLTQQLWHAAKKHHLTDVKFRVLNPGSVSSTRAATAKTFHAHRFILAARSPILADMLDKEEGELTNPVVIELDQVQPSVFKCLLHFIYTGQLMMKTSSSMMDELKALADRFQVSTLQMLCRQPPLQEMNASDLTSFILSLQYSSSFGKIPSGKTSSNGRQSPSQLFTGSGQEIQHSTAVFTPALNQNNKPRSNSIFGLDSNSQSFRQILERRLASSTNSSTTAEQGSTTNQHWQGNVGTSNFAITAPTPGSSRDVSSSSVFTSPKLPPPSTPLKFTFGVLVPSSTTTQATNALTTPMKITSSSSNTDNAIPSTSSITPLKESNKNCFSFKPASTIEIPVMETVESK